MATTELGLAASQATDLSITSRQRWIDLVLVVGVALWQPLMTSTVTVVRGPIVSSGSTLRVTYALLQEFSSLAVLGYHFGDAAPVSAASQILFAPATFCGVLFCM